MTLKQRLKAKALDLGFEDAGFTTTEPLDLYVKEVESRPEMYNWVMTEDFNLKRGANLSQKHPWARSLVVLIRNYHRRRFPEQLIGKIGRCYQVDERIEKDMEHQRMVDFFDFLKNQGIRFQFDEETPARMSAARAGLVTYGKNCFIYSNNSMLGASWLESIPILLDAEIEPDEPSIEIGCPSWCKNACIAACPTGALYAPKKMNPFKCIAFNTYYGDGITPMDLREPMGTWVYGCDRCQEVCPRNQAWTHQDLPENQKLKDRAADFQLDTLLRMNEDHYVNKVWPLTFYISRKNIAKWKMNAARALGNLGDRFYVPVLVESLNDSPDEVVRGMCAWALGRLGGSQVKKTLETHLPKEKGLVAEEINLALSKMRPL
ncbi:MAG: epoxyqueuosine reductase [Deltaproteobacteria bacterium]|nr:epoxyqueuosine reductase [Deltaproteobacteria bacterium]MBW2053841.1 epoxyqueuosine reductase [Deltaproteobacteria bacterium]MBW2142190.1 epoxyqueuosine reductase [Deltaproteobacteria bacterium]MBW2324801.1 epoxyqueuosine reductase [Deltaproteobacteria bacterium]